MPRQYRAGDEAMYQVNFYDAFGQYSHSSMYDDGLRAMAAMDAWHHKGGSWATVQVVEV